jgi:5-methylcytosine-specific restriction enzyme subunit McrC
MPEPRQRTAVVALAEHSARDVALTTVQFRALADLARGRLDVLPAAEPGRYTLRTRQYVGTLTVPGLELVIRPKVPLPNLFWMLAAPGFETYWLAEDFGYATERQLLPAFAALFAHAVERVLGRGLLHAYRAEEGLVPALRGRLDLTDLARHPWRQVPVPCRYQDFSSDIAENRALKAAVRCCLRLAGVPEAVRAALRHQLARLEDVAEKAVDAGEIERLHYSRLNAHYEPALRLAAVVLRNSTLLDSAGGRRASAFLVDMNRVFEAFVADRLGHHLRGRLRVHSQWPTHLDIGRHVNVRPDLAFERKGQIVFVADSKYKLSDDGLGRGGDYYQLLAYTTAMGLPAGLLIYCHPGAGAPPRFVRVRRGGQALWSQAVRVAGSRAELEGSLAELAALVWQLAADPTGAFKPAAAGL